MGCASRGTNPFPWMTALFCALTIRGKDYEYEGELNEFGKKFHYASRGTGGMTHNDPDNRPADIFGGKVTLFSGAGKNAYLLLPIIPP